MRKSKIAALTLGFILAVTALCGCSAKNGLANAIKADPFVFQQMDRVWADYVTGHADNLGPNGCGILSVTNAIYYMNGRFMDPTEVSEWAYDIEGYLIYEGSGTIRGVLYPNLEAKYGKKYGFTVPVGEKWALVTDPALKEHLKGDGVAIAHVKNHFIAVVEYDEETNSYLVLDSAANMTRRGTAIGGDWLTEEQLLGERVYNGTSYMRIDWFCLISPSDEAEKEYKCDLKVTSGEKSGSVSFGGGLTSLPHIEGEVVTFRASPSSGYYIDSVTVNGENLEITNDGLSEMFSFKMPAKNTTIKVKFVKDYGGKDYSSLDIGGLSFDINYGIPVCAYANRSNLWVGMFEENEKNYSVENAVFYYPLVEHQGQTMEMNSTLYGGNISAYNEPGRFKILLLTNSGKVLQESPVFEVSGTKEGLPRK